MEIQLSRCMIVMSDHDIQPLDVTITQLISQSDRSHIAATYIQSYMVTPYNYTQ